MYNFPYEDYKGYTIQSDVTSFNIKYYIYGKGLSSGAYNSISEAKEAIDEYIYSITSIETKTLKDVLLYTAQVRDFVYITAQGYYIGCTIIDHEDLFINSLNPTMLKRKVLSYEYVDMPWSTQKVFLVKIE